MGRLIDADKLNEEFDDLITTFENAKNGKDYISKEELLECLILLRECVDEQPTAYSIEKVVAELEEYKQSEINFMDIVDTGKEIKNPVVLRIIGRIEAYESAINIVRKDDIA